MGSGRWRLSTPLTQLWTSFDEAVEHHCDVVDLGIDELAGGGGPRVKELNWGAALETEPVSAGGGRAAGRLVRQRWPVSGRLSAVGERSDGPYPLAKVTIRVDNTTAWAGPADSRDDVMRRSLVAVHLLMAIDGGRFVSMLDPPEFARFAVSTCVNTGAFPVLVSDDVVLSSPIILYDLPAVAPESHGRHVRRHRDRRDPGPPGPDPDRRREARGPRPPTPGQPPSSIAATR